jgi:hypothetical protein
MTERYECMLCNYVSLDKNNYKKHCMGKKHGMKAMLQEQKHDRTECFLGELVQRQLLEKEKLLLAKDREIKRLQGENRRLTKRIQKLLEQPTSVVNNIHNDIKILSYRDTDVSHLTEKDYVHCLKQANLCVKNLIERVHFNPAKQENMNLCLTNMQSKYMMVYEDGNWNMKLKTIVLDNLYEENEMLLEDWIGEEQDKYPELKKKFERYLDNKEKDETMNTIKDEIKLMMFNKSKTKRTSQPLLFAITT